MQGLLFEAGTPRSSTGCRGRTPGAWVTGLADSGTRIASGTGSGIHRARCSLGGGCGCGSGKCPAEPGWVSLGNTCPRGLVRMRVARQAKMPDLLATKRAPARTDPWQSWSAFATWSRTCNCHSEKSRASQEAFHAPSLACSKRTKCRGSQTNTTTPKQGPCCATLQCTGSENSRSGPYHA